MIQLTTTQIDNIASKGINPLDFYKWRKEIAHQSKMLYIDKLNINISKTLNKLNIKPKP